MKIVFNRQILLDALSGVSKAVSPKSTIPAVEGILFVAEQNSTILTGYNFEMVITTQIEADIEEAGSAVLNARLLGDFVRKVDSENIYIGVDERLSTTVKAGIREINFMAVAAADFPELPKPSTESSLTMNGPELREMIDKTLYAVSQDEQKPVHTGTKFILENNMLTLVSVDGYRLAVSTRSVINNQDVSFIVPARTLAEISRIISDEEKEIYINTARRYAVFYLAKYTVMTRLLEGDFLDYKRSIPDSYQTRVKVDVRSMITATELTSLIITDRLKSSVTLNVEADRIVLDCNTPLGKVHDEIPVKTEGEPVRIGFNNRYLLDALRNSGCDEVYFEINGANRPMKVVPCEGDEFLYLVLPVIIKVEQ